MKPIMLATLFVALTLNEASAQEISKSAVIDCMYQMGDGRVLLLSAEEIGISPSREIFEKYENATQLLLGIDPARVRPPFNEHDEQLLGQAMNKATPMKKALFDGALIGASSKVRLVDQLLDEIAEGILVCTR